MTALFTSWPLAWGWQMLWMLMLSGLPDSSSTISTVGQDMTVFLECSLVIRHDFNLRLLIRPHIPKPKTQVSHFQNWKLGISKAYVVMVWKPYSKRPSCSQQTCRCTEWVERMQRKPRRQTGSVREVSGWTCSSSYCSLEELHTHTHTHTHTHVSWPANIRRRISWKVYNIRPNTETILKRYCVPGSETILDEMRQYCFTKGTIFCFPNYLKKTNESIFTLWYQTNVNMVLNV